MELNFFSPFLNVKKDSAPNKNMMLMAVIGLIVIGILGMIIYNTISLIMLNKAIKGYDSELNDPVMISKMKEVETKENEIKDIQKEKAFLTSVDKMTNGIDTVSRTLLDLIANRVTKNLYLKKIDILLKDVKLEGASNSKLEIAQFEYNIRESGFFENIYVEQIVKDDAKQEYNFRMSFNAKDEIYSNR